MEKEALVQMMKDDYKVVEIKLNYAEEKIKELQNQIKKGEEK